MPLRGMALGCAFAAFLFGCCHEIPNSELQAFSPLPRVSELNGTFVEPTSAGVQGSLWGCITGHETKSRGGQVRLTALNEHTLRVERLVNGSSVDHREISFRFVGGYARISYPICHAGIVDRVLLTTIGCGHIALTVPPGGHSLAVYSNAHIFVTADLLPVPADVRPDWGVFPAADTRPATIPSTRASDRPTGSEGR